MHVGPPLSPLLMSTQMTPSYTFLFRPDCAANQTKAVSAKEECIIAIRAWMTRDKLKLNDNVIEVLLIGTRQQLAKFQINHIKVIYAEITPIACATNLGVWVDSNLNMRNHITKLLSAAFYYMYNISHIRKYLSKNPLRYLYMLSS